MRISDWSSDVCSSDLLHDGSTVVDYHSQVAFRSNEPSADFKRPSIMDSDYVEKTLGLHASADQRAHIVESFTGIARRDASVSFGSSIWSGQSSRSEEHTSELQSLMGT